MSSVLVRLREPVIELPQAEADRLIKAGILELARDYHANTPPEPEALVQVADSRMVMGTYYNKGEIVGCTNKEAEYLAWKGVARRVTRAERDAAVERAREAERQRTTEGEIVLVRFLVSWAIFGTYYMAGEVAGFRGEQLEHVLKARKKDGEPFVHQLTPEETEELRAQLQADAEAAAAAGDTPLVLLEFLISMSAAGSYYNAGEVGGFSREKAEQLVAMHTLDNRRFVKVRRGDVAPPPEPAGPPEIPEGIDVAGLSERDPEGVAAAQDALAAAQDAQEKALERPPKHRMIDRIRGK